jgi:hypothetical protein
MICIKLTYKNNTHHKVYPDGYEKQVHTELRPECWAVLSPLTHTVNIMFCGKHCCPVIMLYSKQVQYLDWTVFPLAGIRI